MQAKFSNVSGNDAIADIAFFRITLKEIEHDDRYCIIQGGNSNNNHIEIWFNLEKNIKIDVIIYSIRYDVKVMQIDNQHKLYTTL